MPILCKNLKVILKASVKSKVKKRVDMLLFKFIGRKGTREREKVTKYCKKKGVEKYKNKFWKKEKLYREGRILINLFPNLSSTLMTERRNLHKDIISSLGLILLYYCPPFKKRTPLLISD